MKVFEKSKWIWNNLPESADEYAEFKLDFTADKSEKQILKIAADSNYSLFVNGELAAFGQYADYPTHKIYDEVDISVYCQSGENNAFLTVWYYGHDSQTYKKGKAGVIFEIAEGQKITAFSSENTLSRLSPNYAQHEMQNISGQLGFTYHYDSHEYGVEFQPSRIVGGITENLTVRPNKKLVLKDRIQPKICMQGVFTYLPGNMSPADRMQYAGLGFRYQNMICEGKNTFASPVHFKSDDGDGIFFILDMGSETAGFLDFDIDLPEDCRIDIGYGEHLEDGRCRTNIRNFTAVYDAKAGSNKFLNTFRRFGCRYVQIFVNSHNFTVNYAGIRPTEYPLTHKKYKSGNLLRDTIYSVCQNTIQQCLHEHYEDCPWREQALYVMDSRNQMLCGYYAFGEFEAPRASLKLISEGLRPDGLLSICYPAGMDFPIPSFSTMYFVQMYEYIKYSGDLTLAEECYPVLERIAKAFLDNMTDEGLIKTFCSDTESYWNFYEWSYGLEGQMGARESHIEAPINAFFSIAMKNMSMISEKLGKTDDAVKYSEISRSLTSAIQKKFYNPNVGLFESFDNRLNGVYSVLTNSLCLLCGAAEGVDKTNILKILASNGADNLGLHVVPNTLSMNSFRFDALLECDREKYRNVILDEIDRDYLYMLRQGATSFWETIDGAPAFGGAGSLCHGWSALPIYYYEILS